MRYEGFVIFKFRRYEKIVLKRRLSEAVIFRAEINVQKNTAENINDVIRGGENKSGLASEAVTRVL